MVVAECRGYVESYGATCIGVDYRLAPEHPFPAAPNDCFDVVKWVSQSRQLQQTRTMTLTHPGRRARFIHQCRR